MSKKDKSARQPEHREEDAQLGNMAALSRKVSERLDAQDEAVAKLLGVMAHAAKREQDLEANFQKFKQEVVDRNITLEQVKTEVDALRSWKEETWKEIKKKLDRKVSVDETQKLWAGMDECCRAVDGFEKYMDVNREEWQQKHQELTTFLRQGLQSQEVENRLAKLEGDLRNLVDTVETNVQNTNVNIAEILQKAQTMTQEIVAGGAMLWEASKQLFPTQEAMRYHLKLGIDDCMRALLMEMENQTQQLMMKIDEVSTEEENVREQCQNLAMVINKQGDCLRQEMQFLHNDIEEQMQILQMDMKLLAASDTVDALNQELQRADARHAEAIGQLGIRFNALRADLLEVGLM